MQLGAISAACLGKCQIASGGSHTPAGGSGSLVRGMRWMCRSRGPRARAGMELGTHKGGCGWTVGKRHLVEQKSTKFEVVVACGSRLPRYRSRDGSPWTNCAASDDRAVLIAVVVAFQCLPGPARWVETSAYLRNLGCSAMQAALAFWHAGVS